MEKVMNASGREFQQRLVFGWENMPINCLFLGIIVILICLLVKNKIKKSEFWGIFLWIFLIMMAQFSSKRVVSEYYFTNLLPIVVLILSLVLKEINEKLLVFLGIIYLGININWLYKKSDTDIGYFYRKQIVDYVKSDTIKNNYPCVAINYIADPGVGVGFRYLFWYEGIKLIKPNNKVPIYNIVIPWQISAKEISAHFGRFGIISPKIMTKIDPTVCQDAKYNLDPLLGYTE
jgi:hypothetical protein